MVIGSGKLVTEHSGTVHVPGTLVEFCAFIKRATCMFNVCMNGTGRLEGIYSECVARYILLEIED
jgi:hypothetical protein